MAETPTVSIPKYRQSEQQVAMFAGGVNAVTSPHTLAPDEVQSATNVDFGLEWGALSARRGSVKYVTSTVPGPVGAITRNYGLSTGTWSDTLIPWYVAGADGGWYAGHGASPITLASISGFNGGIAPALTPQTSQWEGYVYLANGTSAIRTNGTNTFAWILPQADTPTVTIVQQGLTGFNGPFPCFMGTFSATEGGITSTSTSTAFGSASPIILSSCTSGTGTRIVLVGTVTHQGSVVESVSTNWENPTVFVTPPTGTSVSFGSGTYTVGGYSDFHAGYPNGDIFGTNTATATVTQTMTNGVYATDYMLLGLPSQSSVVSAQIDLSIGDTSFTNYWTYNTVPGQVAGATSDPITLWIQANGTATFDTQIGALMKSRAVTPPVDRGGGNRLPVPVRGVGKLSTVVSVSAWAIPRANYQFIGFLPNPDFSNIQGIRVTLEFNTPGVSAVVGGLMCFGGLGYCLVDQVSGISYFQTFARVENGQIVAEGAPSLPSPPQKCNYAHSQLTFASASNTNAGITHRVFYRSGGLLQDAYRVGSCAITTGVYTIYDYGLPDMLIVNEPSLKRNLWSTWPSPSAGSGLPGVNVVSAPWQSRVWVGVQNQLYWSVPGNPTQIQDDTQTTVSDTGDNISAIIPGWNLVVVNQSSVYEMSGSVFEGTSANWSLQRSMSRRGSVAPRTCMNTPYGILLLGYDGVSVYRQGFGVDQELEWVYTKVGDLWKGTAPTDPAQLRGRIPAINQNFIFNACAAFKDEQIYLAVPTGTNTYCDTLIVLNMARQKVWMYQYPYQISTLFWDKVANRLMAGTTSGTTHQLEVGVGDTSPAGAASGVGWAVRTRAWSTPTDMIVENLQMEGVGTWSALGVVDNTNTYTLTSANSAHKSWIPASLQGSVCDNVVFVLGGTQSSTTTTEAIFQLQWDSIPETSKVTYHRTDFFDVGEMGMAPNMEGWWHKLRAEIDTFGTATVTGTFFLDGVVVGTAIVVSGTRVGKFGYDEVIPAQTYGRVGYVVWQSPTPFKHYRTWFEVTAEPTRNTLFESEFFALRAFNQSQYNTENAEGWWHQALLNVDTLGTATCTGTIYIDNQVVMTCVISPGLAGRTEYPFAFPSETYGKVARVLITSSSLFKFFGATYNVTLEPARVLFWETPATAVMSENYVKTWLPDLNLLGGTATARAYVDGVVVSTQILTREAFPSNPGASLNRYVFEVGMPNVTTGKNVKATYISSTPFKHYDTKWELEPKPFGKLTWLVTYKKAGGASQADMARFYAMDIEGTASMTMTSTWIIDGTVFSTNTLIFNSADAGEEAGVVRNYMDQIPFPPGGRGYLFQQEIVSNSPFRVWRASLDFDRIGIKGLTRVTMNGEPTSSPPEGGR